MSARRPPARPAAAGRGEHGSAALELTVWVPALLLVIGLLVLAGRVNGAHAAVEQAATDAARTASSARTAAGARQMATDSALASLRAQGLSCARLGVTVDTAGFAVPAGRPAVVTATVTCPVLLADLSVPGLPGSRTVSSTATSTLDTFRGRTP